MKNILKVLLTVALLTLNMGVYAASVNLSWDASTSPNVDGYKIAMGDASGAYTTIIDAGNNLANTVPNLTPGATYYFAVKAYNATQESVYSNEISFTPPVVAASTCPCSVWADTDIPATISQADSPVELGVKFTASVDGTISAIRWYKDANNTGVHNVHLWSDTGTLLASAVTINETASGWQVAVLDTPVSVLANVVYTASYHTDTGFYGADKGYFVNPQTNGYLIMIDSVFGYGSDGTFPGDTFNNTNYWVDVVFNQSSTVSPLLAPANLRIN